MNYLSVPNEYDASQIVGSRLTAEQDTSIFSFINETGTGGNLLAVLTKGSYLGVVYSYLVKNGQIWWMIKNPSPNTYNREFYYVKHDQSNLDVNEEDIYVSPEEIEANKPTLTETIVSTVLKVATIGVVAYGVTKLVTSVAVAKINK